MVLLIVGIELTALDADGEPVVLSGYKPTYIPNPNYKPTYTPSTNYNLPTPIQLSNFYGSQPFQLSSSSNTQTYAFLPIASSSRQVEERFQVVGDSSEAISNAQFVGFDGSSNSFHKFADVNGNIAISGSPGHWQFTVYAPGYFSKLVNRQFEYNTFEILMLEKKSVQRELDANQLRTKFTISKSIANETSELNRNSEQDVDTDPDLSADAMG